VTDMFVSKQFTFAAAHSLYGHKKCGGVHGHTYTLEITLKGEIPNKSAYVDKWMVHDFEKINSTVNIIIKKYDHTNLNDFMEYPTSEVILMRLFDDFVDLDEGFADMIYEMKLWESPTSYAKFYPNL